MRSVYRPHSLSLSVALIHLCTFFQVIRACGMWIARIRLLNCLRPEYTRHATDVRLLLVLLLQTVLICLPSHSAAQPQLVSKAAIHMKHPATRNWKESPNLLAISTTLYPISKEEPFVRKMHGMTTKPHVTMKRWDQPTYFRHSQSKRWNA